MKQYSQPRRDQRQWVSDAARRFGTKRGYTCGHFPQSFELASVGGWILASGSGQASTYYGDACDLVVSAEYVTPAGILKTLDIPGEREYSGRGVSYCATSGPGTAYIWSGWSCAGNRARNRRRASSHRRRPRTA